jgi:hypothetical protein
MMTATGTHQLAATQSIQDPDSAGAAAGFFCRMGAAAGAGVRVGADVLSAGGGTGVAVDDAAGADAGGGAALTEGAGLV